MNSEYPDNFVSPKAQRKHATHNKPGTPLIQTETCDLFTIEKSEPGQAVSKKARNVYGLMQLFHVLFTFVVVILFGLQTNTVNLSVKDLVIILVVLQVLTVFTKGMNSSVEKHNVLERLVRTGDESLVLARAQRNERRSILLLMSAIMSTIATGDILYIAMIAPDINERADPFRETGANHFLARSLDVLSSLVFIGLALPAVMLMVTQIVWIVQVQMWRKRVHSSPEKIESEFGQVSVRQQ